MANPAASLVYYSAPVANDAGVIVANLTWATYATAGSDKLDLSAIAAQLPFFEPSRVASVSGDYQSGGVAGDYIGWVAPTTPTIQDCGGLTVRGSNGTEKTAGAYTGVYRVVITLVPARVI